MSLKQLLGLNKAGITDIEIIGRIKEAQRKDLDSVEFNIEGNIVKISLPHISFDPDAENRGTW